MEVAACALLEIRAGLQEEKKERGKTGQERRACNASRRTEDLFRDATRHRSRQLRSKVATPNTTRLVRILLETRMYRYSFHCVSYRFFRFALSSKVTSRGFLTFRAKS